MINDLVRRALVAGSSWLALAGGAHAAGMTQYEVVALRNEGSGHAYQAGSAVLKCLAAAKYNIDPKNKGKPMQDTKGPMGEATSQLESAEVAYSRLAESDRAKAPLPEIKDQSRRASLDLVALRLRESGHGFERTEGSVAQLNLAAIRSLKEFTLTKWPECSALMKNPVALIDLLERKVFLERASQLAEAAWGE